MPIDGGRSSSGPALDVPELVAAQWRLRPMSRGDASFLLAVLNEPGMARARSTPPPADEVAAAAWVESALGETEHGTYAAWVIEQSGRPVGLTVLQGIDRVDGVAEVGYFTVPDERGAGIATAALRQVSEWAFGHLDLARLQLVHDTDNESSCRVALSAGYEPEGVLASSRRRSDGTRVDQELHARLASPTEQQ